MENFTPLSSLFGGVLIGLSATMMLMLHGRITGISGIVGGLIDRGTILSERLWRGTFVAALFAGGLVMALLQPEGFAITVDRSLGATIVAGLLVGYGTRLGSGCTSGHGVCGVSRFSPRSLVATGSFMAAGAATVFLVNHVLGGSL